MFGLFPLSIGDVLKMGVASVVAGGIMYGIGHWRGDNAGYERAQAENRQADFDQLKERMETDDEIADMPDADLCSLLGGEWVQPNGPCN
jgi:hypothetical protein